MKTKGFILALISAIITSAGLFAQTSGHSKTTINKTEVIKVQGNCNLCKERIEKAAKIEGVKKAEWNKDTKTLSLTYDPSVVSSDEVQKKIAAAGHDTQKFKAPDEVYEKLPSCCKYR
jgi:mercuric ion binding protein